MIKTTKCVICFGEPKIFGGHVHKDGETVVAGTCEEHRNASEKKSCQGCYGEWREEMGYEDTNYNPNRTYGTDKSEMLKDLLDAGHKVIGITVMACEETFIFQTKEEVEPAIDWANNNGWYNEGWWYAIEDDGEWPWEKARKDYVDRHYEGNESEAPKVYWLNNDIKKIKEFLRK